MSFPTQSASSTVSAPPTTRPDSASTAARQVTPVDTYEVVHTWPHDRKAFTEGLLFHDGDLWESSGQYGESTLRRVDLQTGRVLKERFLGREYFAEGVALLRGKLYQLTWQEHQCFVYDPTNLSVESALSYEGEGWGLTHNGTNLIRSDGTNKLRFLDPRTFEVKRTISVLDGDRPVLGVNELEYVRGEIYANVLPDRRIARIDPRDGALLGWIDLTDLVATVKVSDEDAVLNGMAYDEAGDRLFVTGKRWPTVFEIRIRESSEPRSPDPLR
ncbi:MAG: glutaminyl-peptide cyclotransferase [Sporichthya sp.]|nr:glutaminyl-peptide cyclotransferase [Sporichthya sp.]